MAEKIRVENGELVVPDNPIIPFIEGDGIGPEIWRAGKLVIDMAVEKAYKGKKRIEWKEILAGEKALKETGEILPEETIEAIKEHIVAIKGPLTTPVGGGYRSLNVTLRQALDLYANIRPVKYYKGIPAPIIYPEKVDFIIFRENTEDVYAGIEWPFDAEETKKLREFLHKEFDIHIREDAGIGIKPISIFATKRLMRKAIEYAIKHNRRSITIMHKGNIMKYTEGAFKQWCYEVAIEEYRDKVVIEGEERWEEGYKEGKILVKDRIADAMFQQILLRPSEYDIIITPNLNGDYISDAAAALVGGIGIAGGANVGDYIALFEPVHGSAPKYAGQNKANPSALILAGVMMLRYINWNEPADLIESALEKTFLSRKVTYDIARMLKEKDPNIEVEEIGTLEFAQEVVKNL